MKKYIGTLVLVFVMVNLCMAQKFKTNELTGQWTVKKAYTSEANLPEATRKSMDLMKKVFINSRFNFKPDGRFNILFTEKIPSKMQGVNFLKNKFWKFEEGQQLMCIGTKEDQYNHLRMHVKNEAGVLIFMMTDSPLILELKKYVKPNPYPPSL